MASKLVLGNWKMNGNQRENQRLVEAIVDRLPPIQKVTVAVCPPYPYLVPVQHQIEGSQIQLGAQNLSTHPSGAMTGEVSGPMLHELGTQYVLVGHSERRSLYGESDAVVARKVAMALECGLTPVLCVGETEEERESEQTEQVIETQLNSVINKIGAAALPRLVIAYEPVWAIGTGKTASPQQAQEIHAFIRQLLAQHTADLSSDISILYGGSVKAANAPALFAQPDIDGGLIGGASLDAEQFVAICTAAADLG